MLPIALTEEQVAELMKKDLEQGLELTIDLPNQKVTDASGFEAEFDIHPYWKQMLINGPMKFQLLNNMMSKLKNMNKKKSQLLLTNRMRVV